MGTLPAGTYTLKVKKVNARDPDLPLNLIIRGGTPEQTTPDGQHHRAGRRAGRGRRRGDQCADGGVEPFSSHGPTLDGRAKPEIGAPDNVTSRAYASVGVRTFLGTSAAAPHVGGAAALYKQAVPDATPDAILAFLSQHAATPQGNERGTNITGSGRLTLGTPPGSVNQATRAISRRRTRPHAAASGQTLHGRLLFPDERLTSVGICCGCLPGDGGCEYADDLCLSGAAPGGRCNV